jgi:hypothetical protein
VVNGGIGRWPMGGCQWGQDRWRRRGTLAQRRRRHACLDEALGTGAGESVRPGGPPRPWGSVPLAVHAAALALGKLTRVGHGGQLLHRKSFGLGGSDSVYKPCMPEVWSIYV